MAKQKDFCCGKMENAFSYRNPSFSRTDEGTMFLLKLGYNDVDGAKIKNLAKAIGDQEIIERAAYYGSDEKFWVPILLPIKYCPFCSTLLN